MKGDQVVLDFFDHPGNSPLHEQALSYRNVDRVGTVPDVPANREIWDTPPFYNGRRFGTVPDVCEKQEIWDTPPR